MAATMRCSRVFFLRNISYCLTKSKNRFYSSKNGVDISELLSKVKLIKKTETRPKIARTRVAPGNTPNVENIAFQNVDKLSKDSEVNIKEQQSKDEILQEQQKPRTYIKTPQMSRIKDIISDGNVTEPYPNTFYFKAREEIATSATEASKTDIASAVHKASKNDTSLPLIDKDLNTKDFKSLSIKNIMEKQEELDFAPIKTVPTPEVGSGLTKFAKLLEKHKEETIIAAELVEEEARKLNEKIIMQTSATNLEEVLLEDEDIEDAESFATMLRKSKLMQLGLPRGKVVMGVVDRVVGDDLYIQFGGKFYCVCKAPAAQSQSYIKGTKVRLRLSDLEMTSSFLGSSKHITIMEADGILLGRSHSESKPMQ